MSDELTHIDFTGGRILFIPTGCNQRCSFCMVSEFITDNSVPRDDATTRSQTTSFRKLIEELPPGSEIDFFGAEPTLHGGFLELLRSAVRCGLKCSLATNARMFSNSMYCKQIANVTAGQLTVRTSLLGGTAGTHDKIAGVHGCFSQLGQALINMRDYRIPFHINIVLTRRNIAEIDAMTHLICDSQATKAKLSALINTAANDQELVSFGEVRQAAKRFAELCQKHQMPFEFEKMPLCMAPHFMDSFVFEQAIVSPTTIFADSADGPCAACLVKSVCFGVELHALERFGSADLDPIKCIPERLITDTESILNGTVVPSTYRINFARVDEQSLNATNGLRLLAYKQECRRRQGELFIQWRAQIPIESEAMLL